jgi:hypothetical protein
MGGMGVPFSLATTTQADFGPFFSLADRLQSGKAYMSDIPSGTAEEVEKLKRKFIEDTLLPHALSDSLSQSRWESVRPVFKTAPIEEAAKKKYEEKRQAFRSALTAELRNLAKTYEGSDVDDEPHIKTIRDMGDRLGKDYGNVLNGGKLFFGVAQKALNIYLKYLWCSNFDVRPPHCPFDYDIISRLKPKVGIGRKWTHSDSEDDYREWVRLAKEASEREGYKSSSEWEVATWDEIQRKKLEAESRAAAKKAANLPPHNTAPTS